MPTVTDDRTRPARAADGPVLVRVDASASDWVRGLPSVPDGRRVGVTVGSDELRAAADELAARGYELLGVVPGRRSGLPADILVTGAMRESDARWFPALLLVAARVFDLRFGPVQVALADELAAHLPHLPID